MWLSRKKMGWVATQPITHYHIIPHTILLKTVVSKNLHHVVLLQYIKNHTL